MNTTSRSALLKKLIKNKANLERENSDVIKHIEADEFLLTPTQRGIWVDCQINSDSPVYNIPFACKIEGPLDIEILKNGLKNILNRHDVLRFVIEQKNETVYQRISKEANLDFRYYDLREEDLSEEDIAVKGKEFVKIPFDSKNGPLIRFALFHVEKEQYYFVLSGHHIIYDGSSEKIFCRELSEEYSAILNNREPSIKKSSITYGDYANHIYSVIESEKIKKQLEYWKEELSDVTPTEFPLDYARPSVRSNRGGMVVFCLENYINEKVREYALTHHTTVNVVLFAAFSCLLHAYSNSDLVSIGTTVSNRENEQLEGLMGCFINNLVITNEFKDGMSFDDVVSEVGKKLFAAYGNKDVPLAKLVEVLNPLHDLSMGPFYEVAFNYNPRMRMELTIENCDCEVFELGDFYTINEVNVQVYDDGESLKGFIEYNADLYDKESISNIVKHYKSLLDKYMDNSANAIEKVEFITDDEREIILNDFNDTYVDYPIDKTIVSLFEEQVEKYHDNTAVVFKDEKLTYGELNEGANAVAFKLREMGVKPNDFVAIIADRSLEMIKAIYGILKSGGAYVPIDPTYPEERISFMLEDSNPKAVLVYTDEKLDLLNNNLDITDVNGMKIPVINLADSELFKGEFTNPERVNKPEDMSYCIYTSGTTGKPKGVMVEHRGVCNLALYLQNNIEVKENEHVMLFANYIFDGSVWERARTFINGATLYIPTDETIRDLDAMHKYVKENDISVSCFPPNYYEQGKFDFNNSIVTAGGAASLSMANEILETMGYINAYGPTETSVCISCMVCEKGEKLERITIGKPIDNVEVYILQKDNMCGIGIPGELCAGGRGIARGYLNREELTAEKFVKNPYGDGMMYRTGDLARWLPDGNIEYLGRIDEQVKIRGFRVELGEIESRIKEIEFVKDAAVIVRNDEKGEKAIYAYIVGKDDDVEISIPDVRERLLVNLPDYMIPAYMMQIEEIPVTRNGKVNKRALPNIEVKTGREYVAPRSEIEEKICNIFAEILGVEKVGIKDGFFELGGHSLKATRLVNSIEEQTGIRIVLKDVFNNTTPEKLAVLVGSGEQEEYVPIPIAEEKEYYPMSSAQKRTYLLSQMDSEGILYNMPQNYKLTGKIDSERLRDALQTLINRHEILRTSFITVDGEPMQKILSFVEADYKYLDLGSDVNSKDVDDSEILEGFIKPIDLSNPPLVRVRLINRGEYYILSIDMHHIISDGMSVATFTKELNEIYNGEELKPLTHQFKDYSEWMKNRDLSNQADYWKSQFEGEIPVLDIPTDFVRPQEQSFEGTTLGKRIGKELTEKIKETARKNGVTDFMIFMSAAMVLLSKYSRQEDIVIGTPISGRTHKDTEGMLGMFVNTLALRGKPETNKTYAEFLKEIKEISLKAYENQEYPFEELVEVVDVERDMSRSPLFDVMLVLQNTEDESFKLGNSKAEWIEVKDKVAKFDLSFNIGDYDGEYYIGLEYCTALFKEDSIKLLLTHFENLLAKLAENVDEKIGKIEIVGSVEKEVLLNEFNDTSVEYSTDKTIVELFEEQVEKTPDNVAVVYENSKLTYRELNEKANALAYKLRGIGIKPDDFVAIIADRSLEMIQTIFGVMKSGAAYVPIDPTYPEERIKFMLEDSNPKAVLVYTDENIEILNIESKDSYSVVKINDREVQVIDLTNSEVFKGVSENPERMNKPEDLIYCIYTSGTTGKPKGVMIEHRGVVNLAEFYINEHHVGNEDNVMMFANYVFDASITEIMTGLLSGATLHVISSDLRGSISGIEKYIEDNKISIALLPPMFLEQLDVKGPRVIITAGSESNIRLIEKNKDIEVYSNDYGPTEGSVCATFWEHKKGEVIPERVPIGKPINNKQIYILQGNTLCGIGMPGELCIAGVGLARGYLNRPELTAEKFVKNPYGEGKMYHTGDLARWLPDGNIDYLGRIDEQVKIRGFRVELGEIESRIKEIEGIKDAAVIAKSDDRGEKSIYAYFVLDDGVEISVSDIREVLGENLPDYMIPSYMMQIESIPVTKNGKLDKKALPEIENKTENEYIAPRNEVEELICNAFTEILGVKKVGIKDGFFELGGHSLRATRLVNRIEEQTGRRIALKSVFSNQTPEKLAELVGEGKVEEYTPIPKAEEKEYYLMSSAQKRTYLLSQIEVGGILYNMPQSFKLTGKVDFERLRGALQKIIDRHEILRTSFIMLDGEPVQKVLPYVEADFEYVEYGTQNKFDGKNDFEIVEEFVQSFDLSNPPLVRVRLVDRGEYYLLCMDMHHIVGDGMSMATFIRELNALYNGEELEPLTHQFKDYSEWMMTRDLSNQAAYWKSQFDDEIPVLDMPLDFVRPQDQSFEGAYIGKRIGKELTDKIKKVAMENGATDFMVFMSAAMVLLSKYSRQEDIVIGTPISGRTHKDTEGMLGMFINTLAMRGKPEANKTYKEFLNEIKETSLKAYENQEYPFEELVEAVDVTRDMSRSPLFDVMLILQNNEVEDINLGTAKVEWFEAKDKVSKFDFTINIGEQNGEYSVNFEYCTALFNEESIWNLIDHYMVLITNLLENLDSKLKDIEMIDEKEIAVLNNFNNTEAPYPSDKTVVELFEEQVEKTPDNIAVVYEDDHITYRELNERANALAHKLRDLGVGPDDFIAIIAVRSIEMIEGIYGIIKSGGAYVPIDPTYPEERIKFMLEDANPKAVLIYTDEEVSIIDKDKKFISINDTDIPVIDLADSEVFKGVSKNPERVNKPDDAVYCIYTSGTTGKPKGVPNVNRGLINRVLWMHEKYHLAEEDAILQKTTFTFDVSVWEIIWWSLVGARVVMLKQGDEKSPEDIMKTIEKNKITHMHFVPSMLNIFLLDVEGKDVSGLKSLKYVFSSGEALSKDSLRSFNNLIRSKNESTRLINLYGPTESSIDVTYFDCEYDYESLPIGKPINNVQIYIVQGDKLCGIGMPGELCIGGVGLARGYLNRPELTAEKFVKNPFGEGRMYHTGDLARWLPDGNIDYLGRIDEQVKIRGLRIELGEIESRIREIESVKDAAVIAREDGSGDKAIFAYFVAEEGIEISVSDIRESLSVNLPDYMIPSYIMQIEKIPVTKNGKLDRRALPEIEARTEKEYIAPRNKEEKVVCDAFAGMLNIKDVSVKDDFFELGGDSIKAIRVISGIRASGYTVTVKDIMSRRTVERIALSLISEMSADKYEQGEVVGKVVTTPIMREFNEWNLKKPEHFNQAKMFTVDGIDNEIIRKAIDEIFKHHDILRAVYHDEELEILSISESKFYDFYEFDYKNSEDKVKEVEEKCTEIQKTMDLVHGPLVKIAVFDLGDTKQMMFCIHHYAVDGVSWRILEEDFEMVVEQLRKGEDINLPAKTESFIEWSNKLKEYGEKLSDSDKSYWIKSVEEIKAGLLPETQEEDVSGIVKAIFDKDITEILLTKSSNAYGAKIDEVLIASLARAIGRITNQNKLSLELESHGREEIADGLSIDRTVGWFTNNYAVSVDVCENDDEAIISAKDTLRGIPDNGMGYGFIENRVKPDILFNYLGDFGKSDTKDVVNYSVGLQVSKENILPYKLIINGYIYDGILEFEIRGESSEYGEKFIERLRSEWINSTKELADYCNNGKSTEKTVSDLIVNDMEISDIEALNTLFEDF